MCSEHSLVASYSGPNFFRLLLVHKTIWCSLSSLSIQTRVLTVTFHITLLSCILLQREVKNTIEFVSNITF